MSKERKEIQSMAYAYIDGLFDGKKKRPWVGLTDAEYEHIHIQMNLHHIIIYKLLIFKIILLIHYKISNQIMALYK